MEYLFSTEDLQTSVSVSSQSIESFVSDLESFNSNAENGFSSIFAEIPFWTDFSIRLSIMSLIIVLNAFIIRYYSKDGGSICSYVLALALLDLAVASTTIVTFLLQLIDNEFLYFWVGIARFSVSLAVFNMYLYPSLFLALDRCIAVAFPHKVFSVSRKIRPVKFILVALNISASIPHILAELKLATELAIIITNLVTLAFFCIQLFGCLALYCTVVVLLIRVGKNLNHSKHG